MATEEAAPVPPTLPQYPELIVAAIEAVDDKNGANKTTISKHIETIYGQLPAAHSTLLSHHLNRMKQAGELVLYKNNYLKPDPNAPPRRGRGRPAKANTSPSSVPASDAVVSPARPRGRPPKVVDPDAPAPEEKTETPNVSGRKRGRPKKSESGGRGRGRPPKVVDPDAPVPEEKTKSPSVSGRKRGRPKKSESAGRGRGRPPKDNMAPVAIAEIGA